MVDTIADYLSENNLSWSDVRGVGLAIPGHPKRYGVFGRSPNLPASFAGYHVHNG
jgi:hypothetical protein